jgi:hypothetical protein
VSTKSRYVKATVATFCVIAKLWVLACAAPHGEMRRSPEDFGRVMAKIAGPIPFLILPFETLWMRAREGRRRTSR